MQSCVGTPLDSVEAAVHKPASEEGGTITQVALSFGKHKVCLGTAGGGGLRLADLAPVTDMGEFGRVEHEHFASPVVGSPLRRVSRLLSDELGPDDKEPVGVALGFDSDELWIFNRADDLCVVEGYTGRQPKYFLHLE